jgi:tetratricopeptide (TPR) repeat protein
VAEKELRQALDAFPESLSAGMGLADTLQSIEELEPAVVVYDQALSVAPRHRDAHLRKGIAPSRLGRVEEAIRTFERLVELGFWYLGEAHYWLAWNKERAARGAEAHEHIELAKRNLPDDPRVHELDGHLELDRGDIPQAESAFLTVIEIEARSPGRYAGHDALCESLVALGRIESDRAGWESAAGRFEQAAFCNGAAAALLDQDIEKVRGWSLPAPRLLRLVANKERQRDDAQRRQAGHLYNAAASAFNARKREWCLGLAQRAAEHPDYKAKAEALMDKARFAAF